MSDFKQIQESNFSSFYLDNCEKQLQNLKRKVENVQDEYTKLRDYIQNEMLNSDVIDYFNQKINDFQSWIDGIKSNEDYKKDCRLKEINNQRIIDAFTEFTNMYQNEHLKRINESIEEIRNIYEDIIMSFDPPKINNSSDELIELQMSNANMWEYIGKEKLDYSSFYDKDNSCVKTNLNSSADWSFVCNGCKNKKAIYYCNHCNYYCCDECYEQYKIYEEEINHKFISMDERKEENEKQKNIFMESSVNFIKQFIIKCNCIIKNENQDYVDPNTFKKIQYPTIQNGDDINNQMGFLMDVNETYNLIKEKIDIEKKIDENVLNNILFDSIKKMCEKKKIFYSDLNDIEYDFYSDE